MDPANPLYCILNIWYIDTTYVSGKLGPGGGGHTSKLKMVMTLFFKYLTGNKFELIDISMIRMCNKIKIKASWLQQYLLWMVLCQKVVAETIINYVLSSQNITGVRKCKYSGTYKHQSYLYLMIF